MPRVGLVEGGGGGRRFPRNSRAMVPKTGNCPLCRGSGSSSVLLRWQNRAKPRLGACLESVPLSEMIWPVSYSRGPTHKGGSSLGSPSSLCITLPLPPTLQARFCAAPTLTHALAFLGHLPGV